MTATEIVVGIAVERCGNGPPLVLLHGIGHDRRAWDQLRRRLSPHWELIAVDLPGHGDSPLPAAHAPLGVPELTGHVERLLTELGLHRPVVIGNSLGGAIALELVRREAVRAAIALAPIGFWSPPELWYVVIILRGSRLLARALARVAPALLRARWLRTVAFAPYLANPDCLTPEEAAHTVTAFADGAGLPTILPYSRRYHFRAGPRLDQRRVTVAWGSRDRLLIGQQARRAQRLLPDAHHVELRGSGHLPMIDDPAGVATLITASGSVDDQLLDHG